MSTKSEKATADSVTDALESWAHAHGLTAHPQPPAKSGHVGWLGRYESHGDIEGVRTITLYTEDASREVYVTIDDRRSDNTRPFLDLGYAYNKPGRTLTTRWRIAEGYVNGFPILGILWYAITRHRKNRAFYKRMKTTTES